MKTINLTRELEYHDRPLLFEGADEEGGRYLCDFLTTQEDGEVFLVVPVTDRQVDILNRGESCLRRTLEHVGRDKWYLSAPQRDFTKPLTIELAAGSLAESRNLPQEGYTLTGAWDD